MRKITSIKQHSQIINLRKQGVKIIEIAEKTGVKMSTCNYILRSNGISKVKREDELREPILSRLAQGLTLREIREELGINEHCLTVLKKRYQLAHDN